MVLLPDLSGFTSSSEKLDSEQVKEIMSRISGKVTPIADHYEGIIEKAVGDAIMAIFASVRIHEDDPVRALTGALDVNSCIKSVVPEMRTMAEIPILMHTGINTGLVVIADAI